VYCQRNTKSLTAGQTIRNVHNYQHLEGYGIVPYPWVSLDAIVSDANTLK